MPFVKDDTNLQCKLWILLSGFVTLIWNLVTFFFWPPWSSTSSWVFAEYMPTLMSCCLCLSFEDTEAKKRWDLSKVTWHFRGRAESKILSGSPTPHIPPEVNSNSTGSRTGSSKASRGLHRRSLYRQEPLLAHQASSFTRAGRQRGASSWCVRRLKTPEKAPWGTQVHTVSLHLSMLFTVIHITGLGPWGHQDKP